MIVNLLNFKTSSMVLLVIAASHWLLWFPFQLIDAGSSNYSGRVGRCTNRIAETRPSRIRQKYLFD